jgi:hypothetical protein
MELSNEVWLSYAMVSAILTYALFWQPYVIIKSIKEKIDTKNMEK